MTIAKRKEFGFTSSVASRTWASRDKILAEVRSKPQMLELTRMYPRRLEIVEEALYNAILEERSKDMLNLPFHNVVGCCELNIVELTLLVGLPVNDSGAKELAVYFYIKILPLQIPGIMKENHRFSNGWLDKFKKRYQLAMKAGHGQLGDVDMELHRPAFEAIAQQLSHYSPCDIYNYDETGLYLKVLSNRTLSQGRVSGRKPDTDGRVSTLLCCNADGSDKRKPLVLCKLRSMDVYESEKSVHIFIN